MEKDCTKCENRVTDGVCCGSEENEMVDKTGEKKCFKPDFLDRMMEEGIELNEKIKKAHAKLKEWEEPYRSSLIAPCEYDLLQAQETAMLTYLNILLMRINYERGKRHLPSIGQF